MRVVIAGGSGLLGTALSARLQRDGHTITVLTRGRVLTEGDYATVSADPAVREAYLGVGHE